jgi:hypothetical protein
LIGAQDSFGGYAESLPSVGFTGCSSGPYVRHHNPWVDFTDVPSADNMPFAGYFPTDYTKLPTVSLVVPNLNHDMHDGTIKSGDDWLQDNLDGYVQWAKTNHSLFILTFDEGNNSGSQGNHIVTIFVGQQVMVGPFAETINHYNVLSTIEDMYGLDYLGNTSTAAPITDIWIMNNTASAAAYATAQPLAGKSVPRLSWNAASPTLVNDVYFLLQSQEADIMHSNKSRTFTGERNHLLLHPESAPKGLLEPGPNLPALPGLEMP